MLGQSLKEILSTGFRLYEKGQLDSKTVNTFCSENIIRHILTLAEKNELSHQDFSFINKLLAGKLLPYFLKKYPLSQESQTNLSFSKKVTDINNKLENENDLIYRSNVKFEWRENENYNDKIMEFLNYLLELPQTKAKGYDEKLSDLFYQDMERIFTKV